MIDIGQKVRVVPTSYPLAVRGRSLVVGDIDTYVGIDVGGQVGTMIKRFIDEKDLYWYQVQFRQGLFVIEECFREEDLQVLEEIVPRRRRVGRL